MGALTITLDKPTGADPQRNTGTLTFSATYISATGDSVTPGQLGFTILDQLDIELATNAGHTLQFQPQLVTALPSKGTCYVRAFGVEFPAAADLPGGNETPLVEISTNADLSLFSARFTAWGS
jgi:hypothetical protein